jgi:hypothetical protein
MLDEAATRLSTRDVHERRMSSKDEKKCDAT